MNGQLWEECFCGKEPVCVSCYKCNKHCHCGNKEVKKDERSDEETNRERK